MGNKRAVYIAIGLFLLIGGLYLLAKYYIKDNWIVNLSSDSKDPYGTYVTRELLDNYFPDQEFVKVGKFLSRTLDTNETNANYVYIGHNLFFDKKEINTLKRFAANGNRVFISSFNINDSFMLSLYPESNQELWTNYYKQQDTIVKIKLLTQFADSQSIDIFKRNQFNKEVFDYPYLPDGDLWNIKNLKLEKLGVLNDSFCNFYAFGYGKGAFFIHTTPIVYTNYYLKNKSAFDYASNSFSVLKKGKIYFDDRTYNGSAISFNNSLEKSPIQYILAQPSLSWAWYLAMFSLILYIIFYTKRRQKPIEVLPQPTNSALAFVKNMGVLYFNNNNHKQIATIRLKYFYNFLKERFNFLPKDISNENSISKLALQSGIDIQVLKNLFRQIEIINHANEITEMDLQNLYSEIEHFKTLAK